MKLFLALLKDLNTDVNFSILPRFFMGINHLQQLDFCWTFIVKFSVGIFTKTVEKILVRIKLKKK